MIIVNFLFVLLAVLVTLYGVLVFLSLVAAQIKHGHQVGFSVGFLALLISAVALTFGPLAIWGNVSALLANA